MRDTEIVASIVAGDPEGLATAYDRYADPLFKYCRTLLSDPADAAGAVQDTFVIAVSRLDGLRAPERFRAWLYAVARNECRRIAAPKNRVSALGEAPDVTDESADVSERAGRAELRALFEDAAAGLNSGEREVIELQLRQGLEAGEVASVLGVSRSHAHTLLSRARSQLEACLGVLLVGRAGRDECGELSAMLAGWDGRLTVLLRKRVHRHIEQCATCSARRAFELRPAMLLDLSPGAALAAGAAESLRRAVGAPSGLKAHTIALATGQGPGAVAHSSTVLARAGTFGKQGFPKPAHAGKAGVAGHHGAGGVKALRSSPQGQAAVLIAVAIAAAFALTGDNEHLAPSANPGPAAGSTTPATAGAGPGPTTSPPPGGTTTSLVQGATTTSPAPVTTSPARCPTVTVSPGGATFGVWTGWILPFPLGGTSPPSATRATPGQPRHRLAARQAGCRRPPRGHHITIR
jgi:RNA polymerase sigma factor (sigma-70 family)